MDDDRERLFGGAEPLGIYFDVIQERREHIHPLREMAHENQSMNKPLMSFDMDRDVPLHTFPAPEFLTVIAVGAANPS
jgi:hypothetical protein